VLFGDLESAYAVLVVIPAFGNRCMGQVVDLSFLEMLIKVYFQAPTRLRVPLLHVIKSGA
jgi:hypothetical protein